MARKDPLAFDIAAGAHLCRLRKRRGLTQEALGAAAGITFQQLQKYEKGTNRISLSRLERICAALNVSMADFVAGIEGANASAGASLSAEAQRLVVSLDKAHRSVARQIEDMRAVIDDVFTLAIEEANLAGRAPASAEAAE